MTTSSKTKIDQAARRVAKGPSTDLRDHQLCEEWRETHTVPLQWVRETVERRIRTAGLTAPVVGRLRRMPQIIRKLSSTSTRLTQMQDIGGCRAVFDTPDEVNVGEASITTRTSQWYDVTSVSDYREEGRTDTGYRAIHLVIARDGRSIEVQLRTKRQHAWAEAVERVSTLLRCNLKWGEGPAPAVEFFKEASGCLWELDSGRKLNDSTKRNMSMYRDRLNVLLEGIHQEKSTSVVIPKELHSGTNLWLLVYDWKSSQFRYWMDLGKDVMKANETYARYESKFPIEEGFEVVLIGASSSGAFKTTHSHYFAPKGREIDPSGYLAEICLS